MVKSVDKLWAPWRIGYLVKIPEHKKGSVFARIFRDHDDKKNYVFIRQKHAFAVLNLYPYSNGHVLVIPNRQVNDLEKLRGEERAGLFDLLIEVKAVLTDALKPAGFNIGLNLGRAAGAGIPEHIHFHVVPRWRGDVNFMPVTAQTKVISQSLDALYKELVDAYQKRHRKT
jgi:ATP adenylyltransferase